MKRLLGLVVALTAVFACSTAWAGWWTYVAPAPVTVYRPVAPVVTYYSPAVPVVPAAPVVAYYPPAIPAAPVVAPAPLVYPSTVVYPAPVFVGRRGFVRAWRPVYTFVVP